MLDSHAHIGDENYKNGVVCSPSPISIPTGYRFNSVGLIPECGSEDVEALENFATKGYFVGEVGIDKRFPNIDKQIFLFDRALSIAKHYDRFVTIHQVGHPELVYDSIKRSGVSNFIIHGYTGSYEMAKRFISLGGLISLAPRSEKTKDFKRLLTLEFVTETDMPMSKEEDITLKKWNTKLSLLLDKDIERISEERLLERING